MQTPLILLMQFKNERKKKKNHDRYSNSTRTFYSGPYQERKEEQRKEKVKGRKEKGSKGEFNPNGWSWNTAARKQRQRPPAYIKQNIHSGLPLIKWKANPQIPSRELTGTMANAKKIQFLSQKVPWLFPVTMSEHIQKTGRLSYLLSQHIVCNKTYRWLTGNGYKPGWSFSFWWMKVKHDIEWTRKITKICFYL